MLEQESITPFRNESVVDTEATNVTELLETLEIDSPLVGDVLDSLNAEQRDLVESGVKGRLERKKERLEGFKQQLESAESETERREVSNKRDRFIKKWYSDVSLTGLISQTIAAEPQNEETRRAMLENLRRFETACLDANTPVGHSTPRSLDVVDSGGLSGKKIHGVTTTNDYGSSKGVHFTSLAVLQDPSLHSIDYNSYATGRLEPDDIPGIFITSIGSLVESGFDNFGVGFTRDRSEDTHVADLVVAGSSDRSQTNIPLEKLEFIGVAGRSPSGLLTSVESGTRKLMRGYRQQLADKVKSGELDQTQAATMYKQQYPKTQTEVLKAGFKSQSKWADGHVYPSIDKYTASRPAADEQAGDIVVPIARSPTETGLFGEVLDGQNRMHGYKFARISKTAA